MRGGETMPFIEAAKQLLSYDPETGLFTWLVKRNGHNGGVWPGKIAGTPNGQGYVQIIIMQRTFRAHRLAWLFMTGEMPAKGFEIDHINGDRADNSWANLRAVTRSQNNMNQGLKRNNRSGCKGVSFRKDTQKWHARITVAGVINLLGNFDSLDEAIAARRAAEAELHGAHAARNVNRIAVPRHCAPLAA